MGVVQKDDILVLLSKGGHTEELNKMIAPCKERGALLIAVTENEESYIAKESDLVLKIKVEKEPESTTYWPQAVFWLLWQCLTPLLSRFPV